MDDRENAKRESQQSQTSPVSPLLSGATQSSLNPNEPHRPDVHNPATQNPQERNKWFRNPDWHMVWLTAFLFVVGIITACIFYGQFSEMGNQTRILRDQARQAAIDSTSAAKKVERQLGISEVQAKAAQDSVNAIQRQMRQDQRAWLKVSFTAPQLSYNAPISIPSQLVNTGKTAAKQIAGYVVVTVLKRDEVPDFVYTPGHARYRITAGILFPNQPIEVPYVAIRHGIQKPETIVFDTTLQEDLYTGKSYIVEHGKIVYSDIFGTSHWITFCHITSSNPDRYDTTEAYKKCIAHNNVDDNK